MQLRNGVPLIRLIRSSYAEEIGSEKLKFQKVIGFCALGLRFLSDQFNSYIVKKLRIS